MEENFLLKRNSRDQQSLGSFNKASPSQSLKPQRKFEQAKRRLSYADLHHENTTNDSKNDEKEHLTGKVLKKEEIVKYMSNLPAYLERGSNFQEKGLNVGVLDWGRLERWYCVQKQMTGKNSMSSSSSSNRSLAFSTNESSLPSGKGHSSPSRQRVHRPLLQSRAIASSVNDTSPAIILPIGLDVKNGVLKPLQSHAFNGKQNFIRADGRSCRYTHCIEPEKMKRHCLAPKVVLEKIKNGGQLIEMEDKLQASQKDITESSSLIGRAELNSEIPHPCQIPCEGNKKNMLIIKQSFVGIMGANSSSETSNAMKQSANRGASPSKTRILLGKNSVRAPMESRGNNSSSKVDLAESRVTVEKSRNFSSFNRLSIGLNRKNKGSSSIDNSDVPHRSSATTSVQPKSENAYVSIDLDASSNDKRWSSPLRRLLDPILKKKAAICHHARPSERDSIEKTGKSSNIMSKSSTKQFAKVRLDMSRCRKIDVNQAVEDKKRGPTTLRALLQAVFKNGLPLLTFTVDNFSDVLAATRKSTGLEKEKTQTYTFFTIREIKKKTRSWINQGGICKGRDFISNVVAQMKVSELQFSNSTRREKFSAKEFVLFSVNRRLSDQQNLDFQSDNELAAIVIKIQSTANASSQHSCGSETTVNTTVILPSGNHSVPNKGGPSSLIERWNSGGTCDCGGWDLGCRLRILASSNRITKKPSSSDHYSLIDQLVISSQDGEGENQPILRMSMIKDRFFSIEFSSTLSHVQAFSISTALLDGRNLCEFLLGERTSYESKAAHHGKPTASNRIGQVPAEYIPNPPPSPFERV